MATLEQIAALEQAVLSSPFNGLSMTRYLGVSALTCAVYDHALTFGHEVEYIWAGWPHNFSHVKALYVLIRYGIEGALIYSGYMLSGFRPRLDEETCKSFAALLWTLTMIFSIATNLYVAIHHYTIWDRNRRTLWLLFVCFVCTYIPATVVGVKSVFAYRKYIVYLEPLDQCAVVYQPGVIKGFWGCLFAYDVLTVTVVVMNSFHRPYAHHQDIVTSLRRDGALWFVGVMFLRLMNLVLSIVAKPAEVLLVVFNIWSLLAITLARLILRTEGLRDHKPGVRVWNTAAGAFELSRFGSNTTM